MFPIPDKMSGMGGSGVGNMSGIGNMTVVRYEGICVYRTSGARGLTVICLWFESCHRKLRCMRSVSSEAS